QTLKTKYQQDPMHYGPVQKYAEGGNDPLDGVSVYKNLDPPHWHYITFGLSELYEKESDIPDVSGFGFELTFRLACKPEADSPPIWAVKFLQSLAKYVVNRRRGFDVGHYI